MDESLMTYQPLARSTQHRLFLRFWVVFTGIVLALSLSCAGCYAITPFSADDRLRAKPGMTPDQVREVLGEPLKVSHLG